MNDPAQVEGNAPQTGAVVRSIEIVNKKGQEKVTLQRWGQKLI